MQQVTLPKCAILWYVRKVRQSDAPVKLSEEDFNEIKGFEPMWWRGTYQEYSQTLDKYIEQFKTETHQIDRVAIETNSSALTTISRIEKLEDFRSWVEPSKKLIESLKNS
jgi:hypothetical protein